MIYSIKKNKFFSPFLFFCVAWIIVYFLYLLYWSNLLPKMIPQISLFICGTVFVVFILFIYTPGYTFNFEIDLRKEIKKLKKTFLFTIFLFIVEAIFFKGFPLLSVLTGNLKYGDFGLPFVHVVYYAISSVACAKSYLFYCLSGRKHFLWYTVLFLSPGILIVTRSYLMYNIIYILIIYLSVIFVKYPLKRKIKSIFFILVIFIVIVIGFGAIGNARSNASYSQVGSEYINTIAKPSENFGDKNPILLWFYCYVTTPLGNLINTINNPLQAPLSEINDFNAFFYHFLPDLIKKRLFTITKSENLIVPYFNVSTVYASAYVHLGYIGLIYSFVGTLLLVFFVYKLKRNNVYSYLNFVFLSTIVFFNMFTNMYNFMGLAPQFWLSLFFMFGKEFKLYFFRNNYDLHSNSTL